MTAIIQNINEREGPFSEAVFALCYAYDISLSLTLALNPAHYYMKDVLQEQVLTQDLICSKNRNVMYPILSKDFPVPRRLGSEPPPFS